MIRLPPEITFDKRPLPGNGRWSYDFRHRSLGALGRILLQDLPGRRTHISCEVAGDPAHPRTAKRRAIFEPLGLEIARQMERATGRDTDARPYAAPPPPTAPTDGVEGKLTQCPRCGASVAMLVFAPGATDAGRFEDYARLMYPEYSQRGLPTWVIGPALGPGPEDPADNMQVWPIRKQLQRLTPGQFNPRLDRIAARHCRWQLRLYERMRGFSAAVYADAGCEGPVRASSSSSKVPRVISGRRADAPFVHGPSCTFEPIVR